MNAICPIRGIFFFKEPNEKSMWSTQGEGAVKDVDPQRKHRISRKGGEMRIDSLVSRN